ncbi:MarR family winged helix-turn-helix transcriptional regulator [Microbacterium testaceum]|uniref:MarR family winged helix-turn-helix transcriptional regulator n=1 Tax=Microbacterium testaceum TaxID=2033 RepID=UPI000CCF96C2|nr:MarR family transcriptional regulator [Microbacterium testaceum]PNW10122.1 transcriptional regulator [Microbacterium testaceum]WJS91119.1 MarR family transcriptional regulator [Microbacterium testaceum]
MTSVNALSTSWSDDEVGVMHGLRDWAMASDELNRHLSTWMGLPVSDAEALGQIVWAAQSGSPVSPALLARQMGMTSGAVSVLIDRLERAGYVTRHREGDDRRRVVVRPTATALEGTERFLGFAGAEVAAAVRETPEAELRVIRAFLGRMTQAASAANTRLRDAPASTRIDA